jgi:hypothetical protein
VRDHSSLLLTVVAVLLILIGFVTAQQPQQTQPPPQPEQQVPPQAPTPQQQPQQPPPPQGDRFPSPNTQPSGAKQDHVIFNWNLPAPTRFICVQIDTVNRTTQEIKCPSEVAQ